LTTATWQQLLARARTEREVVSVARDYLAHFDYRELDDLPERCQPPKVMGGGDIASYAFELKCHHCEGGGGQVEVIRKLSDFFSEASNRIAQIAALPGEDPAQGSGCEPA
jgi:hypothetical protein